MASHIITAEAIIKGKDETGGAFAAIAGKIDALVKKFGQVGKAAAISAKVEQLARQGKALNVQLAGVERLRTAEERMARLSVRYAETRAAAELKASASTAAAAKRAATNYYKQLDAVSALKRGLEGSGVAVNSLAAEEARLKHEIDGTNAALGRQNQMLHRAAASEAQLKHRREAAGHFAGETGRHLGGSIVGGGAALGGAFMAARAIEDAAKSGADFEAALNRVRNVSGGEKEVALARDISARASAAHPYTTRARSVEDYIELRSLAVSNKPGEAINREAIDRNVMLMARSRAALASSGYPMEAGDAKALAQAIEGSGRTLDPRGQEKMLDAYVRAKQVFGNAMQAHMVRDFVQTAKSANFSASDDSFFFTTMARLAQGNASRLGNEFNQTLQTLVGGHMTKAGAEWLARVGMIGPNQIRKGGGGKFYIAGKIKEQGLLSTDQTAWAQQVLLPGIERTGALKEAAIHARAQMLRSQELRSNPNAKIDDRTLEERALHGLISDYVSKSGFRTTVTDNLVHSIANMYQTKKDVTQMRATTGLAAADTIGNNPQEAFDELKNSISSFLSTAASPTAKRAGQRMHGLAGGIANYTAALDEWQKNHPDAASGVTTYGAGAVGGAALGVGAYLAKSWLAAGPALTGAAGALTTSAAELSAAALELSGGKSALGNAAKTAAAAAGGAGLGGAGLGVAAGVGTVALIGAAGAWAAWQQWRTLRKNWDRQDFSIDPLSMTPVLGAEAAAAPHRAVKDEIYGAPSFWERLGSAYLGEEPPQQRFKTGLPAPSGGDFDVRGAGHADLGIRIRAALDGLKATIDGPVKVDPVKLEGAVAITVRALPGTEVAHTSSSGQVEIKRASPGTSMQSATPGGAPP